MALINCPDCEREVSERAPVCVHCGAPIGGVDDNLSNEQSPAARMTRAGGAWEALGLVLIVVGLIMSMAASGSLGTLGGVLLASGFVVFIIGRFM